MFELREVWRRAPGATVVSVTIKIKFCSLILLLVKNLVKCRTMGPLPLPIYPLTGWRIRMDTLWSDD